MLEYLLSDFQDLFGNVSLTYDDGSGISLTDFFSKPVPKYAILSRAWGADKVKFKDLRAGTGISKVGYEKISFCGNQARADYLEYF